MTDPDDPANLYVYIQGTGGVRPAEELAGCSSLEPNEDPNTSRFRIEVVRVPLDAPERAEIVSMPRIFADPTTGDIAGLWAAEQIVMSDPRGVLGSLVPLSDAVTGRAADTGATAPAGAGSSTPPAGPAAGGSRRGGVPLISSEAAISRI